MGLNICKVCGKTFLTQDDRKHVFCSEECRKAKQREYNSNYVKERYQNDEEFRKKKCDTVRPLYNIYAGKKRWAEKLEHANKIMELAKMESGDKLIARYIDYHFQNKSVLVRDRQTQRASDTDEEIQALETLKSFGDKYVESN